MSLRKRRNVLRRRLITEDDIGEIARQQRRDEERQQRYGDQHRYQVQKPRATNSSMEDYSSQVPETSITPLYIFGKPFSFALDSA